MASGPLTREVDAVRLVRGVQVVRASWGVALTLAPHSVCQVVGSSPADARAVWVARVLGLRHTVQGLIGAAIPTRDVTAVGMWVDAVHALTALTLCALDPPRRRVAAVDAATALVLVAVAASSLPSVGQAAPDRSGERVDATGETPGDTPVPL